MRYTITQGVSYSIWKYYIIYKTNNLLAGYTKIKIKFGAGKFKFWYTVRGMRKLKI